MTKDQKLFSHKGLLLWLWPKEKEKHLALENTVIFLHWPVGPVKTFGHRRKPRHPTPIPFESWLKTVFEASVGWGKSSAVDGGGSWRHPCTRCLFESVLLILAGPKEPSQVQLTPRGTITMVNGAQYCRPQWPPAPQIFALFA